MVSDLFDTLLHETGEALGISELHQDQNNSCLISLKSGIKVQLELDKKADFMIMGCDLGEVLAGRYRENLFQAALKANDLFPSQAGIFAFSTKTAHLILFQKIALEQLNGAKIASILTSLVEKAAVWIDAIAHNDVPVIEQVYSSDRQGMFGLKR